MPSAPAFPERSTVIRTPRKIGVFSSKFGNVAPTDKDLVPHWIPLAWSRSSGGQRLNSITIRHDFAKQKTDGGDQPGLRDTTAPVSWERQVELRQQDENGEWSRLLCWGFLSEQQMQLGENNEDLILTVRLEKHHFGVPLTSHPVWNSEDSRQVDVEYPMVWNPERLVNGTPRVMPNRSSFGHVGDPEADPVEPAHDWKYFISPESLRTDESESYQEQTADHWDLVHAVHTLCWILNPDEEFIENPTLEELDLQLPENLMLKNQSQDYGDYLPDALDKLLTPHRCGWYVEMSLERVEAENDDPPTFERHTKLRFFQCGSGRKTTLLRQRSGVKSLSRTKVQDLQVGLSVVDMANVVQVFGDFEKRESTWVLSRGWDENVDDLDAADLERGVEGAEDYPWTGRKYVLNEAGDYIGLRVNHAPPAYDPDTVYELHDTVTFSGHVWRAICDQDASNSPVDFPGDWYDAGVFSSSNEVTSPYDLTPFFTANSMSIRRRRFLPCLSEHSSGDDGQSNRFFIEWLDPYGEQAVVAYDSERQWCIGEIVSYGGDVWSACADNVGVQPGTDDDAWTYLGPVSPATWNAVVTYSAGDVVNYGDTESDGWYRCRVGNSGEIPTVAPQFWTAISYPYVGAKWTQLKGQVSILEHECGILFESARIPEELWAQFKRSPRRDRVRITCTIQGDRRVQAVTTRRDDSPNNQEIRLVLELPDKFQDAQVHELSRFHGDPSHARDDSDAILEYAETVRDVEDCADLSTSVFLEGTEHPELTIGALVTKVEGIEVALNGHTDTNGVDPRYPQIVGFDYDYEAQTTQVMLESFKEERIDPDVVLPEK